MKPSIFLLTCADQKEAEKIRDILLEKRLIVCGKIWPVESKYWWQGIIEKSAEIIILMESDESKFESAEKEIRKIHSYKTFVLESLLVKTTQDVKKWLLKELIN